MESGEGIESEGPAAPSPDLRLSPLWNPVKELKGVMERASMVMLMAWNPVKELKVINCDCHRIELKLVESGEGIESTHGITSAAAKLASCGIR